MVALRVLHAQVLVASRHHSGLGHEALHLFDLTLVFAFGVFGIGVGLIDDLVVNALLPVLVVSFVVLREEYPVVLLEELELFLVDGHKHRGEHLGAVGINEQLLADALLVDNVAQVLLVEGGAVLLAKGGQLRLDLVLLVQQFL